MFCATKQSSLKETGDEACETDAESKPCLSVLWCKYLYDCKLNTLMVMLKALIIFDKQMRRKYKKNPNLKTVINMKTVF